MKQELLNEIHEGINNSVMCLSRDLNILAKEITALLQIIQNEINQANEEEAKKVTKKEGTKPHGKKANTNKSGRGNKKTNKK